MEEELESPAATAQIVTVRRREVALHVLRQRPLPVSAMQVPRQS
jgi:hypothetical protein